MGAIGSPKCFSEKGELAKSFAQKTVKNKSLKLLERQIVKWIFGK